MKDDNNFRIFVPHDMLILGSGVMLGIWSSDKSIACVTCLGTQGTARKGKSQRNCDILGFWKNSYNDRISDLRCLDELDKLKKNPPENWLLLEKHNAGLPVCTVSHGKFVFTSTMVIIYDAQKLQQSYYLTDAAHKLCMENGMTCTNLIANSDSNIDQLTYMLVKHGKLNVGNNDAALPIRNLTILDQGVLNKLCSKTNTSSYNILKCYWIIAKVLCGNRYVKVFCSMIGFNKRRCQKEIRGTISRKQEQFALHFN